jgi:UDP-glucose 4-epimerase
MPDPLISLIAGGAGFIGCHLVSRALAENRAVIVVDDFSRGDERWVRSYRQNPRFKLIKGDVSQAECFSDIGRASAELGRVDEIWHMAANSDIPAGNADPEVDLHRTFLTTFRLLQYAAEAGVRRFYFASSSAIYGDVGEKLIHEDLGPLLPISNYGAMKLASEAQISAAAESVLTTACIYRFPNVVGIPATHGVILDFVRKLKANPSALDVLGDGTQQKAYLHVTDLVDAMMHIRSLGQRGRLVYNIGQPDAGVLVRWIAEQVVSKISPNAAIRFGSEQRGWIGDVPKFRYSVDRLNRLGWQPKLDSSSAVLKAIEEIAGQEAANA